MDCDEIALIEEIANDPFYAQEPIACDSTSGVITNNNKEVIRVLCKMVVMLKEEVDKLYKKTNYVRRMNNEYNRP